MGGTYSRGAGRGLLTAYLDASLLVSLLAPDANSGKVDRWMAGRPHVVFSDWTVAETSSAFAGSLRRRATTSSNTPVRNVNSTRGSRRNRRRSLSRVQTSPGRARSCAGPNLPCARPTPFIWLALSGAGLRSPPSTAASPRLRARWGSPSSRSETRAGAAPGGPEPTTSPPANRRSRTVFRIQNAAPGRAESCDVSSLPRAPARRPSGPRAAPAASRSRRPRRPRARRSGPVRRAPAARPRR